MQMREHSTAPKDQTSSQIQTPPKTKRLLKPCQCRCRFGVSESKSVRAHTCMCAHVHVRHRYDGFRVTITLLGFRLWNFGRKVSGLGFRVSGSGYARHRCDAPADRHDIVFKGPRLFEFLAIRLTLKRGARREENVFELAIDCVLIWV